MCMRYNIDKCFQITVALCIVAAATAYPSPNEDGRWNPYKYGDDGK